jgi:hypothetical protein
MATKTAEKVATKLTITEGLAEIKTILKRVQSKQQFIVGNAGRVEKIKDPLENDGGSQEVLKRERQAYADLLERIVKIRGAIQQKNHDTTVAINGKTRSVTDWLTWRKEVAPHQSSLLSLLTNAVGQMKVQTRRAGNRVVSEGGQPSPEDIVLHLSETELAAEAENLEKTLGDLDGKLSLINATTTIEIPD